MANLMDWDVVPASTWPTLQATLTEICLCLTETLPSAESAGVVILAPDAAAATTRSGLDRARVIGAAPAGAAVLEMERVHGDGPLHTACQSRRLVSSGAVTVDERWPRFGVAALDLQLNSAATMPLTGPDDRTVGVFSTYSHQPNAFDARALHLIAAIAGVARNALLAAATVESARRAYQTMSDATEQARMVNQAVGVLIHRNCTEEQARWRLSRMASRTGEDVTSAARAIVEEARTEAHRSFIASRHAPRSV